MPSALSKYYVQQAGSGLIGFEGVRYQKGHGLWGKLFGFIRPALRYLGNQALGTGLDIADDVLDGKNLKESALNRFRNTGRKIASDTVARGRQFAQTGSGRKRRRRVTAKKTIKGRKRRRKSVHPNSIANLRKKTKKPKRKKTTKRKIKNKAFDFLQ